MATLKDVAALSGVTQTTISRMLNDKCNVSQKTRDKILHAMKELNYEPNELARSLSKKSSNFIGLIIPSVKVYFFSELTESIEAYVSQAGCKLMLCIAPIGSKKEFDCYNMLMSNKVRGIIILHWTDLIEKYVNIDSPVIVLDRIPNKPIPCALTDNYRGGYLAGKHLIEKGCRSLLYFGGEVNDSTDTIKRYKGFADACAEAHLPIPIHTKTTEEEISTMNYEKPIQKLFAEYPKIDGIFASNDIIASAVIHHAMKNGIQVPKQLKVIGYDDTSFARNCTIPLTTIHQPIDELSRYAVECIIKKAKGEVVPISTVFPVHLVEREST